MSVEKMEVINIIGLLDEVDIVIKRLITLENIHLLNALEEIQQDGFSIKSKHDMVDETLELSFIQPFSRENKYDKYLNKVEKLRKFFEIEDCINEKYIQGSYNAENACNTIDKIYDEYLEINDEYSKLKEELNTIDNFYKNFMQLKDIDINIKQLEELNYFNYTFGILSRESRLKLRKNYENILAIALHAGNSDNGEVYLFIYPKKLEEEINKILKSLNFKEIEIPKNFGSTPKKITEKLEIREKEILQILNKIDNNFFKFKQTHLNDIKSCLSKIYMEEKIQKVKEYMAKTKSFFYISGWVSVKDKKVINDALKDFKNLLIIFKDKESVLRTSPPTKLRNNKFFKPFEMLVKMYGIPSYSEIDPTPFFSITYMFLFGAMFGDLGQGLILLLGGLYLYRNKSKRNFGSLIIRLGASSMVFGLLYGAFFGFENIIPSLLIRPFENINTILISAVIVGIFLIFIGYIYNIINCIKNKNLEEGVFGKNGIAGFGFYVILLLIFIGRFLGKTFIPTTLGIILSVVLIVTIILKQPLTNIFLKKKPLYNQNISEYYIESSFSIIETLLSMLSNTVSFIRVGAFALTHVGLFVAFQTVAQLVGSPVGNVIILTIGNIVIIGLEGLIVFIQSLRLEYYELFSKYYKGEGKEFNPVTLSK